MPDAFTSRVRELAGLADDGDARRISVAVLGALADHLTEIRRAALADDLPERSRSRSCDRRGAASRGGMDEFYAAVSERSGLRDAAGAVGAVPARARRAPPTPAPSRRPASSFPTSCAGLLEAGTLARD